MGTHMGVLGRKGSSIKAVWYKVICLRRATSEALPISPHA